MDIKGHITIWHYSTDEDVNSQGKEERAEAKDLSWLSTYIAHKKTS